MASNAAEGCFFFFPHSHKYFSHSHLNVTRSSHPRPPPDLQPPLQICVGKDEESDGFLRLSSGKRRGLIPATCLLEI